jgi:hypothetical protein
MRKGMDKFLSGKGNRKMKGEGKETWRENLQIGWFAEVEQEVEGNEKERWI